MNVGTGEIDILRRTGILPAGRHAPALRLLRDDAFWARWARHALLALGLGHLLAGIIFFFAYNWADLQDIGKFAAIEAGILIATLAALWRGPDRLDGAAALVAATVLTGALLAVIGQVYQTGADPWALFALWALLSLPWVVASRNAAHWLVWLVVLHVAVTLALFERLVARDLIGETAATAGIALLPLAVLVAREYAVGGGMGWADRRWTRLVPALAGLIGLCWAALRLVFDPDGGGIMAAALFAAALAAIGLVYRRRLPDLAMLAAAVGFAGLFLIVAGGRLLFTALEADFDSAAPFLMLLALLIIWVVGVVAAAARLLGHLRRDLAGGS